MPDLRLEATDFTDLTQWRWAPTDEASADALCNAGTDLRASGTAAKAPSSIAGLCNELSFLDGTDLPGLVARLSPNPQTAEQALQDLVAQARQLAETPSDVPDDE